MIGGRLAVAAVVVAALVLAVVAAGWLRGGGDAPPGGDEVTHVVDASSLDGVASEMRKALTRDRVVRVEYSGGAQSDYRFSIPDVGQARLIRDKIDMFAEISHRQIAKQAEESDPVRRELRIATESKQIAVFEAARQLLEEGGVVISEGYVKEFRHGEEWYYNNFRVRDLGIVYAPIDLRRFPQVADAIRHLKEIKAFADTDAAYRWNSKPYETRKRIVEEFRMAKKAVDECRAEFSDLAAKERDGSLSGTGLSRLQELRRISERLARASGRMLVRDVDPATFEWSPSAARRR